MGPSNYIKYCSPGKAFDDSLFEEFGDPAPISVGLIGAISWGTDCGLEALDMILSSGRSSSSESWLKSFSNYV